MFGFLIDDVVKGDLKSNPTCRKSAWPPAADAAARTSTAAPPGRHVRRPPIVLHHRRAPVAAALMRRIVARRGMQRAAVVPQHQVADAPLVAVIAIGRFRIARQLRDQGVAFGRLEALDRHDLAGIEIDRLAPGFRMDADQRVNGGGADAVLLLEKLHLALSRPPYLYVAFSPSIRRFSPSGSAS